MFGCVDFRRERCQGLARRHTHRGLIENRTAINFRRHAVDGATRHLHAAPESLADAVEPFSTQKLTVAIKQEARQPSSLLAAEVNRRPEPLESYPLDSVTMVGSLMKQNKPFALLRVDKLLYQVKLGDYLGQNYGKIVKISETDMSIREVVQDASGEWTERTSSIQLQEKAP